MEAQRHPLDTVALVAMDFPERLATLRHSANLSQQALADSIGVHVTHLRRYEAGKSQPTLEVLRKLAVALSVSADLLLFDTEERGPGTDLRLQFEATQRLNDGEKQVIRTVIEGIVLQHEARLAMERAR